MKPVIFFDWDGTLADSMNLCVAEIRQALITMRLPDLPDDVLRQCNGPTGNRLFPGVREMLQTLREYADLCIVSNGEHDYIALCLQVFGLTDVFVRTATSVPGRTKGENLRALLDDLRPERAVMVGDRLGDIRAGQENGLPTIAACYGYGNDAEYNQASLRAESVADLTRQLVDFCRTGRC